MKYFVETLSLGIIIGAAVAIVVSALAETQPMPTPSPIPTPIPIDLYRKIEIVSLWCENEGCKTKTLKCLSETDTHELKCFLDGK